MSSPVPTLHLLCGKIAAGKSTLASRLSHTGRTVLISEDLWLNTLFADQLSSAADYVRCAARLRAVVGPHASSLLAAGLSVVLDFPANTVESRQWMRGIFEAAGASHQLHVLTATDDLCLHRLQTRNAGGNHPFVVTEAQFRQFTHHYVAPSAEEGFTMILHDQKG